MRFYVSVAETFADNAQPVEIINAIGELTGGLLTVTEAIERVCDGPVDIEELVALEQKVKQIQSFLDQWVANIQTCKERKYS